MAKSFGGFGLTVNHPSEFSGALEQALESGRPSIIDVKADIESITPDAWKP
jgi:acetolactate synthase-1/2/3 large subunit